MEKELKFINFMIYIKKLISIFSIYLKCREFIPPLVRLLLSPTNSAGMGPIDILNFYFNFPLPLAHADLKIEIKNLFIFFFFFFLYIYIFFIIEIKKSHPAHEPHFLYLDLGLYNIYASLNRRTF